jgi:hypothetical protein
MSQLVNLRTNLKSLRYGKDRVGGGNSNQPYIKSPIPESRNQLDRSGGVDFLLRGGTLTPSRAVEDVSRLTQMFFDFKSPNGVLFTAKQNLLSRTGVKTQASGILNEGAYLPTSTILQAGGNAFGTHLNKQGINPFRNTSPNEGIGNLFGLRDPLGLPVYAQTVKNNQSKEDNRLVQLANRKLEISTGDSPSFTGLFSLRQGLTFLNPNSNFTLLNSPSSISSARDREILRYGGGPGSILGVGKTVIERYSFTDEGKTKAENTLKSRKNFYGKTFFPNITPTQTSEEGVFELRRTNISNLADKTNTNRGLDFNIVGNNIFNGKYYVLDAKTIFNTSSSRDTTQISDFRASLLTQQETGDKKNILSQSPKYSISGNRIENRVNLGDPGRRNKNVLNYTNGLGEALDKITATPLYSSAKADHGGERNDLVKFSIGIIDNDTPNNRTYIHFRAFLDSMDDNYNAEWNSFKYMGRGENFYRYNGFTRAINLSWTVAAQSKEELIPMYQKLNFLASSLAPDYSEDGYMRGNLAVLTVGGYLFEQPGIINSINYSVPTESPWEIGINNNENAGFDDTVKELPHIIRVTGFNFTPIHTFVPKLQQNKYDGIKGNISEFGSERYIALSKDTSPNASTTNYNLPNNYIS